jgi:hypothetical protein
MLRARHLASILVLATALGCAKEQPKAVFVDVGSILAAEPPFRAETIDLPKPPSGIGPQSYTLAPMAGRALSDRSHGQIQEARRILEQDRRQAQRTLERRLRTIYQTEVEAKAQDEIAAVQAKEAALLDAAYAEIRTLFEAYAEKRGPLSVRLELVTNPQRHRFDYRPPEPGSAQVQREQEEIRTLRRQIAELDATYDTQANAILAQAQDTLDRDLTRLRAEIEERKTAAGERAQSEAAKQVKESREGLDLQIGRTSGLRVPPAPGRKVNVAGTAAPEPPPATDVRGLMESPEERRVLLEQQVEIWVKINGYRRVATPSGATNATQEFKAWRATYKAGR